MPDKEESSARHRMVVEEIEIPKNPPVEEKTESEPQTRPDILNEGISDSPAPQVNQPMPRRSEFLDSDQQIYKEKSPVFWILISGIFILGAILGGVFFYQKGVNTAEVEKTPTPQNTISPSPKPSTAPATVLDLSEYKIAIFNGSGIAGEAGRAKDLLVDAGFTVSSTGNAATYDYEETIIKAKASVDKEVIKKLKDTLSENYVLGEDQTLTSSATTDLQIVVGSSKAE